MLHISSIQYRILDFEQFFCGGHKSSDGRKWRIGNNIQGMAYKLLERNGNKTDYFRGTCLEMGTKKIFSSLSNENFDAISEIDIYIMSVFKTLVKNLVK